MTRRDDFSETQWFQLWRTPISAATAVMLVAPGGMVREGMATFKALQEAPERYRSELLPDLLAAANDAEEDKRLLKRLKEEQPRGKLHAEQAIAVALDDCHASMALLAEKATPEEAAEYRDLVLFVAGKVAGAAKEGGIFGLGGVRVSDAEQRMLDDLAAALA